jgi:hypothetical protein
LHLVLRGERQADETRREEHGDAESACHEPRITGESRQAKANRRAGRAGSMVDPAPGPVKPAYRAIDNVTGEIIIAP